VEDEDLENFEDNVVAAFAGLSFYGFTHKGSQFLLPDLYVHFRNSTTDITLSYELGSAPQTPSFR
jgi:hypothetical protein